MSAPRSAAQPGAEPGPRGSTLRLNRYLALCGAASRRHALELIQSGRVTVNAEAVSDPGRLVNCGSDRVELDGEALRPPRRWLYYAFHKPRGVIVTLRDEAARASLPSYLRRLPGHVVPIGRLDRASEGLLLLTNHGDLAHALLHPRREIEKVYRVRVTPRPSPEQVARMARGVPLGHGEHSGAVELRASRGTSRAATLTMVLREGKKREVRRICRAVGLRVLQLRRLAFAGVRLGELAPGRLRPLTPDEIAHLRGLTGLEL